MEQMPHHREGIQNDLDKAYDEGHRDNATFDEAQAKYAEIKSADIARKEYGEIGDKEARGKLSLEETVALLKEKGYLDTSFEGKETHLLTMLPLTKEQALDEYKNSGGETSVWDTLEKNMPYTTPNAETLDIMIMNFNKEIGSDEALAEMDKLGVRPLTYEELIQYGVAHPDHQKQKTLIGLGSQHSFDGDTYAVILWSRDNERCLYISGWGNSWDDRNRFPVVRK